MQDPMQQRIRMARLFSASLALVLSIVVFVTGEWEVGLLILALSTLLFLRVYLVRDVPRETPRHGGDLVAPEPDPTGDETDDNETAGQA